VLPQSLFILAGLIDFFVLPQSLFILAGLVMFGNWLLRTSLGRRALVDSVERRNNMAPYIPFIPLIAFYGLTSFLLWRLGLEVSIGENWMEILIVHIVNGIMIIATSGLIIFLARQNFARGLRGFGLNVKTIPRDFGAAVINLLTIWPVLFVVMIIIIEIGDFLKGPDFQVGRHEELQFLGQFPQLYLIIAIFVLSVVLVPIFEELVFRGLFQSFFRSYVHNPWAAMALSSVLFVMLHANKEHWPVLFVLSMAMGYAYEKSGSLFRSIFIHAMFNASAVIVELRGNSG
jgi:membrane protease YdiL (CAAX protease family)